MKEIIIRCKGADELSLDELTPLQGRLKDLTKDNFIKLKTSLLDHGFAFPFFVWRNEGKNYILDGHQRDHVLNELKSEPDIKLPEKYPVAYIDAINKTEAAKLLLLASSQYGTITNEGLYEFLAQNELNIEDMKLKIQFDALNINDFADGWGNETFKPTDGMDSGRLDEKSKVVCPECKYEFTP